MLFVPIIIKPLVAIWKDIFSRDHMLKIHNFDLFEYHDNSMCRLLCHTKYYNCNDTLSHLGLVQTKWVHKGALVFQVSSYFPYFYLIYCNIEKTSSRSACYVNMKRSFDIHMSICNETWGITVHVCMMHIQWYYFEPQQTLISTDWAV